MTEVWRDITDYPGYQVSNFGRVRSYNRSNGKILKQRINPKTGYMQINLYKDKVAKTFRVHKLVADAFNIIFGCEKTEINHIDGDKRNNRLDNLERVSHRENILHAFKNNLFVNENCFAPKGCVLIGENGKTYSFSSHYEASFFLGKSKNYVSTLKYKHYKSVFDKDGNRYELLVEANDGLLQESR